MEARDLIEAPFEEALLIGHDKLPRNGNGSAAPGDAVIPDSFGDEIRQALQTGARAARANRRGPHSG